MPKVELFLQVEGRRRIDLIEIDADAPVREILKLAAIPEHIKEAGLVFEVDGERPLDHEARLCDAGVGHRHRVHVHRCHQVDVSLHFNDITEKMHFPPSATVERVKRRFVEKIRMSHVDATEHALQLCGTDDRPEPDNHIGAFVSGCCSLCFDLVPIKRVEG
ncbi:hypothetical protein [Tautonia sociabilis]|uniref:Ubiquitin-like domain-containing protein n=1 Tax=Tautonia sociabilis TaxID=2080755 RepID=A0A432MEP9_9BACT|nr:hypothetical protein [Tautonia sociabilis]RUL84029.1 hypothetical protein TsocGM_21140 [Tautonia sociabilis]